MIDTVDTARGVMRVKWLIPLALIGFLGRAVAQNASPQQLFAQHCAACHGDDATGTDRGLPLARSRRLRTRSATEIHDIIHNGTPGGMPPSRGSNKTTRPRSNRPSRLQRPAACTRRSKGARAR